MIRILRQIEFSNLEVDPKVVWRLSGYSDPIQARPSVQQVFHRAMEMGPTLLEPAACYDIFQVEEVTSSSVEVEGDVSFESRDLAYRHREARELAAFITTIGPRLGEQVNKCRVLLRKGARAPAESERVHLTEAELEAGWLGFLR